jgi:hypothetical protein
MAAEELSTAELAERAPLGAHRHGITRRGSWIVSTQQQRDVEMSASARDFWGPRESFPQRRDSLLNMVGPTPVQQMTEI